MTALEIFKLESETDLVSKLNIGVHKFGRGPLLQCDDRRVSRNHGFITVTHDEASITSTHQNPCFFQLADSKTITILPKDSAVKINNGDKFALLADQFWFKIKIVKDSVDELPNGSNVKDVLQERDLSTNEIKEETDIVDYNDECKLKRNFEEESSVPVKKMKLDNGNASGTDCGQTTHSNSAKKEVSPKKRKSVNSKLHNEELSARHAELKSALFSSDDEENETNVEMVTECSPAAPLEADADNINQSTDIKITETVQNQTTNTKISENDQNLTSHQNKAGSSGSNAKRPWRDYCVYGLECYRKNAEHLAEYTHPGDSDYESDPNDERPLCAFGPACYRKNKDHRKTYKHPRDTDNVNDPPKKRTKQRAANTAPTTPQKRKTKKNYKESSSEDEYDMNDPFMADSGSEFEVDLDSGDDSDSDMSEGSQEEVKRLLKEANRFTRSKKKDKD